jgi:hypothetical protein
MSLMKKADVKNHLSTRHRHEIHLCRPEDQPAVAGVVEDGSVGVAPETNDPIRDPLNPPAPGGQGMNSVATASGPGLDIVATESKSAKS